MQTMWLACAAIISVATLTGIHCQPPCDSPFRLRRPDLFKHCECLYGDWSEWEAVPDSLVNVSTSQCHTGQAYSEIRQRVSLQKDCSAQTEKRQICE